MFMTAKEIAETFSKKDPNEGILIYWHEAEHYLDPEDLLTQEVWDKKAPDYRMQYVVEESDIIGEYLRGDYQL